METFADAGTSSDVVGEALAGVTDARGARLLQRLEDFFASPEFSTAIGDFMCEHLETFAEGPGLDLSAEQPLSYYAVFDTYRAMIETRIEDVLRTESATPTELYEACERARRAGAGACSCLDYLLACAEYENFIGLVADFASMQQWGGGDGGALGDGLHDGGGIDPDDPFAALEGFGPAGVGRDDDDNDDVLLGDEFAAGAKISTHDDREARPSASSKYLDDDELYGSDAKAAAKAEHDGAKPGRQGKPQSGSKS